MSSGFATVKEVISGDTVVLVGQPRNGPPPEIKLNLSSLQAPKLARGSNGQDEPFAWQSREFLRKLCIGKSVTFKIEYIVPSIGRTFGAVRLVQGNQENVCVTVAREGWAKVKSNESGRENECSADLEEMLRLQEAAQSEKRGIYADQTAAAVRSIKSDVADLNALKSAPQRAIIEYIRDGASMRVLLVDSMTSLNFNLSGVQCPRLNSAAPGADVSAGQPEPYSQEARYFTELRLLNREVNLVFQGVEKNTYYGAVVHPAGNLSVELVKYGLAKVSYWTLKMVSPVEAKALGDAQRAAQLSQLRVWRGFQASTVAGESKFEGIISEVVSADCIMVRCGTPEQLESAPWECIERKLFLSSISAPRKRFGPKTNMDDLSPEDRAESELYIAAKEFLRSKVIGKKCTVTVEYERAPIEESSNLPAKQFATVVVALRKAKVNAAVMMVSSGYARIVHHRRDQNERSMYYDAIVNASHEAEQAKRGVFAQSKKGSVQPAVLDLCGNPTKAKGHLPFLTRGNGLHKAIVEYCHNGARMKVSVPAENCVMNFALAGVMAPQNARAANKGRAATPAQPWAGECLALTRSLVLQREVDVEIETMDKGGCAIGTMYVTKGSNRLNVGATLVSEGLASVNEYSASMSKHGSEVVEAEEAPKNNRLRIWEKYDAAAAAAQASERAAANVTAAANGGLEMKKVTVSEVVNGNTFYVQEESEEANTRKSTIDATLKKVAEEVGVEAGKDNGIVEPRVGGNCLALFDDGNGMMWYRARLLSIAGDGKTAQVRYLDFGNVDNVPMNRLRNADPTVFSARPLATECKLAFLVAQNIDDEFGTEAAIRLSDLVYGQTLKVKVVSREEGQMQVIIHQSEDDKDAAQSVNEILCAEGLLTVEKRPYTKSSGAKTYLATVRKAQESAHKNHLNLWQYGDFVGDDSAEFGI